jgi:hypothetical protein
MVLPSSWFESCVLGTIRPSFLLPLRQGENLGVPIYEERLNRQKRGDLQIGNWNDRVATQANHPYYSPPTWAEDRSGATAPQFICSTASSGCRLLLK